MRDGWEPQYKKQQMDIYFTNDTTMSLPEPLMATDASGNKWKQSYVYGAGGERISMSYLPSADANTDWEPTPGASGAAGNTTPKTLFYMSDVRGSAIGLLGADGSVSARYHYDEFGVTTDTKKFDLNWAGPDNLFGYTGLGYDFNSGYSYARARYIDSEVGRFISEDTYEGDINNPQTLNLYTYVSNNPLRYTDPSGHIFCEYENSGRCIGSNNKGTGKTYITKQNLIDIGWNTDKKYLNDSMVKELNSMLNKYGITEPEQIYHFLSQVMKESDDWNKNGRGDGLIEIGSDSYITGKYEGRSGLGNTQKGDGLLFRGAGYLHLTGRSNYTDFYNYMCSQGVDDPKILSEGNKRVAEKYAWESAAWYWSVARPSLNEKSKIVGKKVTKTVNDDGKKVTVTGNSTVFEVTKLVNGGTNGIADRMKYYYLVKEKIKF